MKYLNLSTLKNQLNIDVDFLSDDEYLAELESAALSAIENHLARPLSEVLTAGNLPSAISHAARLLIAHWYANRESVGFAQAHEIPLSYQYLLQPYKSYKFDTSFGQ